MHLYPSAISIQVRWVGGFAFYKTPCSQFAEWGLCGYMDSEFHDDIIKDVELYTDIANPIDLVTGDALPDSSGIVDSVHGEDESPQFEVESSVEAIGPLSELHSVDPSALHDHVDQPVSSHEDPTDMAVPSVDKWTFDKLLEEAHMTNSRTDIQKLPWETGIMAAIFNPKYDSLPSMLGCAQLQTLSDRFDDSADRDLENLTATGSGALKRPAGVAICDDVIKVHKDANLLAANAELWNKALNKWLVVLECTKYVGLVGAAVQDALWQGNDALQILRDVFGTKSPRTSDKRASTMMALFTWTQRKALSIWPIEFNNVSQYLIETVSSTKGSTKGKSLLEAFRFCKFVLQLPDLDELIMNPILVGRVKRLEADRGAIKQCRPLTLGEVQQLERFMFADSHLHDKYVCGCLLFALYSRSRWSDLSYLDELSFDIAYLRTEIVGFIESSTRHQKTSSSAVKKALQMPLVCPLQGVTRDSWALKWHDVLKAVKFDFDKEPIGALCRPPTVEGLGNRPLTSEEAGNFINALLELEGDRVVTSHCLKTTTLTWCSKYGLDEPCRTLLGHHELQSRSLACYSREMLSRPLAHYQAMLKNIREGRFLPDETRSGRFVEAETITGNELNADDKKTDDRPVQLLFRNTTSDISDVHETSPTELGSPSVTGEGFEAGNDFHDIFAKHKEPSESMLGDEWEDLGALSSSSSSSDSSSQSTCHEEELLQKVAQSKPTFDCEGPLYQHKKSRVLHRPAKGPRLLLCGRRVNDSYSFLQDGASFKWPRCNLCFKGEVLTNVDEMVDAFDKVRRARNMP